MTNCQFVRERSQVDMAVIISRATSNRQVVFASRVIGWQEGHQIAFWIIGNFLSRSWELIHSRRRTWNQGWASMITVQFTLTTISELVTLQHWGLPGIMIVIILHATIWHTIHHCWLWRTERSQVLSGDMPNYSTLTQSSKDIALHFIVFNDRTARVIAWMIRTWIMLALLVHDVTGQVVLAWK